MKPAFMIQHKLPLMQKRNCAMVALKNSGQLHTSLAAINPNNKVGLPYSLLFLYRLHSKPIQKGVLTGRTFPNLPESHANPTVKHWLQ